MPEEISKKELNTNLDTSKNNSINSQINQLSRDKVSEDIYGTDFHLHLLEQYKIYIEMMDRVTSRRLQTSSIYISLLSALLALLAITNNKELFDGSQKIVLFSISLLGLVICFLWNINVRSYKQLNSLKFKVIHEMESYLPFPCYDREWQILKEDKTKKYIRLANIEQYIPLVLALPYLSLFLYSILSLMQ
jgi:hypothetical protein